MKKTLIALVALSGLAMGDIVETIALNNADIADQLTSSFTFSTPTAKAGNWSEELGTTSGGITVTYTSKGGGKTGKWDQNAADTTTWANADAVTTMNTDLGTAFTIGNIAGLNSSGNWGNGGDCSLTLALPEYFVGQAMTLYVFVSNNNTAAGTVNAFSVTGLSDISQTAAVADGNGFGATSMSTNKTLSLVKVTGTVTNDHSLELKNSAARNGWSMVAYKITPEPATATLSLLALAGLAARRKRH